MKISIFGLGYVGCVGMGCLADLGHHVIGVDINGDKINLVNSGKSTVVEKDIESLIEKGKKKGLIKATADSRLAVLESDISFICVGTPIDEKGYLDLNHIYKVATDIAETLKEKNTFHVVAIRSTVMPGTNGKVTQIIESVSGKSCEKDFAVVSNPEFLREGSAVYDFFNPPYILVAGSSKKGNKMVRELYSVINTEILEVDIEVGEIIKFVNNTFHALKVVFANEIGRICKKLDIDSYKVMEIFCKDKMLNISGTYFKPGFAYGGSCLPKDLKALSSIALDQRANTPVIESIPESNKRHIEMVEKLITEKGKRKIGFLGITFKAGTDDLRFSPALEVGEYFIGKGYSISIYDANVNLSKLIGKNKEYLLNKFPHIAEVLVDSIEDLMEICEVIVIVNREKYVIDYLKKNKKKLSSKIIIDFTRIDENIIGNKNYEGICW